MKKEEILVVAPYSDSAMALFAQHYELHVLSQAADPEALLQSIAPRIRALATNGESGASARLMDSLPHLEIIVCNGVGVDPIDLAHAAKRGIRVTNTPDVLTDEVADMGIGLLLSTVRRIPQCDAHVRSGQWGHAPLPLTARVFGKRLGILGLGRVGKALARRAAAFGLTVAYHNRKRIPSGDIAYTYYDNAVELARHSDFLAICASANSENRASISRAVLDALGPTGFLINIGRGSIVDEPVLIEYLQEQRIAGAGLDVFWNEPAIDPRFLRLDNVVLQPHRASATTETRAAMAQLALDNLLAFSAGKPLLSEYKTRETTP
ncbi:MAG: 2-hydroxyacid dehydrogenase [Candidatus Accumulibacter sp.]|nr:2-hydroxyacid dehydrogenase [Accumulibacter sp.]